ncbi:endonuclease/exonuclease/phosphatase family protein [Dermatophilaceae bacterium Sec6.4]
MRTSDWFYAVLGLAFVVALGSRWLDVTVFGLLPALQATWMIVTGLLLVVGIVLTALRRWRGLVALVPAIVAAALIVGQSIASRPPTASLVSGGAARFAVVSANMKESRADVSDIAARAYLVNADVIILAETDKVAVAQLLSDPRMVGFKYQVAPVGDVIYGTALLSRHPLRSVSSSFGNELLHSFQQPSADVVTPGGVVRLQGVHVFPPVFEAATDWRRGLDLLAARANESKARGPFVMAGDFNASTAHPGFRNLADGFDEATALPKIGLANSWPVAAPFTRLDHILSSGMAVESSDTFSVRGSDHKGVWAIFQAPTSKTGR